MSKALLQQALDALEQVSSEMTLGLRYTNAGQSVLDVLPALRAAIDQPDEPITPTDAELHAKGWATGHYIATCKRCNKIHDFTDKRSAVCRDCASDLVAKDKAQPDDYAVHAAHCDQDENEGSCKYGEDTCPIMAKKKTAQPDEPVAWIASEVLRKIKDFDGTVYGRPGFDGAVPLYLRPAPYVPLSDDAICEVLSHCHDGMMYPQDNIEGPRAMKITEGRAIERPSRGDKT